MFGVKVTIFKRFDFFRLTIEDMDFDTYSLTVNRMCELAQYDSMSKEDCKCIVFVAGLQGDSYVELRTRLLQKLETNDNCTLKELTKECHSFISAHMDSIAIVGTDQTINIVQYRLKDKKFNKEPPSKEFEQTLKQRSCFKCGEKGHYANNCPKRSWRIKKIEGRTSKRRFTSIDFGMIKVRMQLTHLYNQH